MTQLRLYIKFLDLPSLSNVNISTVIDDFTTPGRSHIYGLPYPSKESLDPMDLYYALMFQYNPQKFLVYTYTRLLKKYSCVYVAFDLKPTYIWMCAKCEIFLEFSSFESE